ncbi:MAG TPA: serine/threonine-protein kinase, partial [Kofleriaceae bacterium]|nr:serine/threonine-protein kinase [Kofleriaceae bacterium]
MGTGIGQTLDKYELLEKVGQGGMAVVYRGLDTALRREVAVKVLHRHLADHKEARERFEREAQAVAKLRHENILEIFDFSGTSSDESYIVTEFIDGQTLKEFITEHEIKYPEIGAMITVQVCRALGHAHSLGVLHRDVKPENIMIRSDGVVKLTDFGIAQMLDHHRLTVTGQLLGSPAYMAPEHVEGGKLDFRTDVFAAGIVLYQLSTGELPFRGKNPHEILKRIAECTYVDPRQVNPLVGNELGAIIKKCLARDKDDRYADVSQMQAALEQYLAGSGLTSVRDELGRFFAAPVAYEMALRPRLIATLTARGRDRLADDRNAALELFNRVLTMDPQNAEVLAEIDRLSRQRRWARTAALVGTVVLLGGGALAARHYVLDSRDPARTAEVGLSASGDTLPAGADAGAAATAGTSPAADAGAGAGEGLAAASDGGPPADAAPRRVVAHGGGPAGGARPARERRDAGAASPTAERRTFTLAVFPNDAEYSLDDGASWTPISGRTAVVEIGPGEAKVRVRKQPCCAEAERFIRPGHKGGTLSFSL